MVSILSTTRILIYKKMLHDMEQEKEASYTACPAPGTWLQHFEKAGHTFAITISSQLSGSMNSALTAMDMALEEHPERRLRFSIQSRQAPSLFFCVHELKGLARGH